MEHFQKIILHGKIYDQLRIEDQKILQTQLILEVKPIAIAKPLFIYSIAVQFFRFALAL